MQRQVCLAGVILLSLMLPDMAYGQSGNHWTEQFGNRSMLLSGAVIGSVSDLGLVFYNPGRLALVEKPEFVIAAKAYQWDHVRLRDGLGDGVDLKDTNFGGAPSLAAGSFSVPFLEGHRFAYAFLTRRRDETDVFLRTERSGDLLDRFPGDEFFSGTVDISGSDREDWMGLAWSHAVGGRWSLGVSGFYYSHSRKNHLAMDLKAQTETNDVLVLARNRTFSYRDQGLVWKAGVAGVFLPFSVGITVTSPRVSVLASGRVEYEDLLAGLDPADPSAQDNVLVTNVQSGLPVVTRSPWAVGAGVGVAWGRATLHLAGEWYSSVPKYVIMKANPFEGQSTGEMTEYRVVDELESVLNGAVGIEWRRGETLSLFGSIASNASATPRERSSWFALREEVSNTTVRLNIPQLGGGFIVSTSRFDLTLGGTYSWATDVLDRPVNLPDEGDDPVFGGGETTRFEASRWRFLLGFSFPLADRLADKAKGETGGES